MAAERALRVQVLTELAKLRAEWMAAMKAKRARRSKEEWQRPRHFIGLTVEELEFFHSDDAAAHWILSGRLWNRIKEAEARLSRLKGEESEKRLEQLHADTV